MAEHPKGYCPVFGNYPKEYNRAIHGPYYPFVNYGPRDKPFNEVKLGEFKDWFSRRNKTPSAIMATLSRGWFNYTRFWVETKLGSPSKPLFQVLFLFTLANMFPCYGLLKQHRSHKYHW